MYSCTAGEVQGRFEDEHCFHCPPEQQEALVFLQFSVCNREIKIIGVQSLDRPFIVSYTQKHAASLHCEL